MDNATIARIFGEIADLLEIRSENPFKIRAYRNAADIVSTSAASIGGLCDADIRAIPGIGRDLAGKIREIIETGNAKYHAELLAEYPPTILDLLRLQGVGPKTVAMLHGQLGIGSLADLEAAARDGRLRALRGMGRKKEELLLRALEERRRHAGRHALTGVHESAESIIAELGQHASGVELIPVGSLRRGCDTCGDLDILAIGAGPDLMDAFTSLALVDRVLGHGPTKSSILLRGGLQADLRLVGPESRGAAMQYFTGSKAHNIALRDRALQRGLKLNEYGLFRDEQAIAGETEAGIYEALGLPYIPPELREDRGEIAAAEAGRLPDLIERRHLRGDVHMHTTRTDGRDDLETMVQAARDAGLEYIAITEHSQSLAMANGLDERGVREHAARIRAIDRQIEGLRVLAGIECDILADGALDLADDCLAELDLVVASVHSAFNQDEALMTARFLRAMESPWVDIIGHPTGRKILRREPYKLDFEQVVASAARHGVALEINCQEHRLDLGDVQARQARERGAAITISSDAHSKSSFDLLKWGTIVARRAWLGPADVMTTRSADAFLAGLRRNRTRPS